MGLSVSDAAAFSVSAEAVAGIKAVLAQVAGGVDLGYVDVSLVLGSCTVGRRWWGSGGCKKW